MLKHPYFSSVGNLSVQNYIIGKQRSDSLQVPRKETPPWELFGRQVKNLNQTEL